MGDRNGKPHLIELRERALALVEEGSADLRGNRQDCRPAALMLPSSVQNQANGTLARFGGILVRRLAHDAPSPLRSWSLRQTRPGSDRRYCRSLAAKDSQRESMRLDGLNEQAITRPLPYDELVELHCVAMQARISADLAGQGHDLARAA